MNHAMNRTFRVKPANLQNVLKALSGAGIAAVQCQPHTAWMGGFLGVDHTHDPSAGMCGIKTTGGTRKSINAAFKAAIKK